MKKAPKQTAKRYPHSKNQQTLAFSSI